MTYVVDVFLFIWRGSIVPIVAIYMKSIFTSYTAVELGHIHSRWTKKLEGKFTTSGVCLIVLVPNNLQIFAYVFSTNFYLFMVPGNCKIQFVDNPTLIHMLHICDVSMISITGLYLTVICANE